MEKEFRTLARFGSLEEAQVINVMLESMGIHNEIMSGIAAQVMPYLEGDVRIVVNARDYDQAREVLNAKFDKSEFLIETK